MDPQPISKLKEQRTLNEDPQYFGGYLNMARLNVFNISNHIANEFGFKLLEEDSFIKNSFLCDKKIKAIEWNHVYSKAVRFLPILRIFDTERLPKKEQITTKKEGKDFALMSDTLKIVFGELQEFRNDYSHYFSTEKENNRKLNVSDDMANFLQANFQRAIGYTKERFQGVFSEKDFELVGTRKVLEDDGTITAIGLVFLICIFLEREYAFQFIRTVRGLKGTQYDNFLVTREVLMSFCLKMPHDKFVSDDKQQAFILDLINELNRCPADLYDVITEEEKQKFRPQLNELKAKNLFNNSLNEKNFADDEDYDVYMEILTKRVRHRSRFTEFALKYIDEAGVFSKFRFQVNLGRMQIGEYKKPFNGAEEPRRIIENIKAFGRLNEFLDEEKAIQKIVKTGDPKRFELFYPRYHYENNKIGLFVKLDTAKLIYDTKRKVGKRLTKPVPDAFLSIYELQKIVLLEYLKVGEAERLIDEFLIVNNQMLTIPFIEEIKSKMPQEWDAFERRTDSRKMSAYSPGALNYILERKRILNQILEPNHLNDKHIPTRILDYWLNIKDVEKGRTASERIKLMKSDCKSRLKALKKFRTERKGKIPKVGEMATFLARDIIGMIVSEGKKKKITSFYYYKIQECLALFAASEKKELFLHIITNELKLNEPGGHPFLFRINMLQMINTSGFYERYLQEKGEKLVMERDLKSKKMVSVDHSWMAETFYKAEWNEKFRKKMIVVQLPEDKVNIPFTLRQLEEKNCYTLEQWLHNRQTGANETDKKQPVNLPTNLFDEQLCKLLRHELDNKQISYLPNSKWNELFKIWWKSRNDDTQPFYKANREYMIFDEKVRFVPNSKLKFTEYYRDTLLAVYRKKQQKRKEETKIKRLPDIQRNQVEKVFKRTLSGTEKVIRIVQEEDQTVLLMLEKLMGNQDDLKLCKIASLLTDRTLVKQQVTGKLSFDINGELLIGEDQPEITRIIKANRKRKDYTVLRQFIFDRRLPELFEYFGELEITMKSLKTELDAYNKAKHEVFDSVFELEKKIVKEDREGVQALFIDSHTGQRKAGNIQHFSYLDWLLQKGMIDGNTRKFMNMVRNCFSHNQFPQKGTMDLMIEDWEPKQFACKISAVYKQKIDQMIKQL